MVRLQDIKCPVCTGKVNSMKSIEGFQFNREIVLLCECWSGKTSKSSKQHLFLVKLNEDTLPIVDLRVKLEE